jgi:HEPN domain
VLAIQRRAFKSAHRCSLVHAAHVRRLSNKLLQVVSCRPPSPQRLVNRSDFQKLADVRVQDAKVLLDARRFDGAYYLVGYAVECALKACIAKQVKEFDFPDRKIVTNSWVHNLTQLLRLSGVGLLHDEELKKNPSFDVYWGVVRGWEENSRYANTPEKTARDMFDAVTDPNNGILTWLKNHW